jgi:type IV fimbrial biogenesis protein FimT
MDIRLAQCGGLRVRIRGLGLLELVVVIALTAWLASLAWPSFTHWLEAGRLRDRAEALVSALNLARSEAIKRGTRVDVCKSVDRRVCAASGDWSPGWIAYAQDDEASSQATAPEVLRSEGSAEPALTVHGNLPVADYVSYTSLGHARRHDGALQMGTFVVCRHGHLALHVVMANSGRLRVVRTQDACP